VNNFKPIAAGSTYTCTVTVDDHGVRLDAFIAKQFPSYSRSFFQRMIAHQLVQINGSIVIRPGVVVKKADSVTLTFPTQAYDPKDAAAFIGKPPIPVIFEHEHFLIIDKPAGWVVHAPHRFSDEVTVVDWLISHYPDLQQVGIAERPGIVHRLDKETSGLLIIARTNYAHQQFGALFVSRTVQKTYLAVVVGVPAAAQATISLPIGRDPVSKVKMKTFPALRAHDATIRAARTDYRVLETFKNSALLELKPLTGRTHQIRVHCAAIGHPLMADKVYGQETPLMARHALHAQALAFVFDEQAYDFCSPLPDDFAALVHKLRTLA